MRAFRGFLLFALGAWLLRTGAPEVFTRKYNDVASVNEWALRLSDDLSWDMAAGTFICLCGAFLLCLAVGNLICCCKRRT